MQSRGCYAHDKPLGRRNVRLQLHVCLLNKDVIPAWIRPICTFTLLDDFDNVSRHQKPIFRIFSAGTGVWLDLCSAVLTNTPGLEGMLFLVGGLFASGKTNENDYKNSFKNSN